MRFNEYKQNTYTCYYHDDMDGIASAAIFKKAIFAMKTTPAIDEMQCNNIQFRKVNYGDVPDIKDYADTHVIVVDFSFLEKDMLAIKDKALSLTWIDHHKSAREKLQELWNDKSIAGIRDSNSESACMLTWKYYFLKLPSPLAVEYINDWDIWRFKFGNETKTFHEGLCNMIDSPTDSLWDFLLAKSLQDTEVIKNRINSIKLQGANLMSAKYRRVEKAFESGTEGTLYGYKTFFVNASCDVSDLGNYIVEKGFDIAFIWKLDKEKIRVSLRSKSNVDVSQIAKSYGGGGHHSAAGFELNDASMHIFKLFGAKYDK